MSRAGSNERQREFAKEYERLCYRFRRHEVWQDFVTMAACAISNAVDKRHAEKREEWYLQTIKKYSPEEREIFPHLFALVVCGMEEHPDQDFLGELYMQLELGNAKNGQFFTPYDLCKCMAEITIDVQLVRDTIRRQGYVSINDPACGAGATLVAAAIMLREARELKGMEINYQQQAIFIGQDIDYTVGLMCYIQLSILGCAGYVHIGNTLTDPMTGHALFGDGKDTTWYTPMYFSDVWCTRRVAENMRNVFRQFEPAAEAVQDSYPETPGNAPRSALSAQGKEIPAKAPKRAQAGACAATEACEKETPPPEPVQRVEEPTFTISTKKKNAGQLMFDFG